MRGVPPLGVVCPGNQGRGLRHLDLHRAMRNQNHVVHAEVRKGGGHERRLAQVQDEAYKGKKTLTTVRLRRLVIWVWSGLR